MAGDLNRVVLIGRLTRDPEIRYIPAGTAVASFTLANNRIYAVSGERKEQVYYFDCVAWSKLAEVITEYCKKGHRIAVEGRLQQTRWDDQDGKKRSRVELVVENFQFLTTKVPGDDVSVESRGKSSESINDYAGSSSFEENPFSDDDIPF
ncbi:MAG: single-stranded DNA-binding protein [Spirochaetes bacterium]|nr:single-stranded DNA-binding protein [Spirochaetota bacterium]